jgi:glycosyltransferase involved in cell wall biosynthesis
MKQDGGPVVSVVVPIYNEVETIDELCRRLRSSLSDLAAYEVVIVDDASTDGSWELVRSQVARDPRIRAARLSRNFGHQVAISAGLDFARGQAVVIMDGDLQDPPEVIPSLVAKWREGYDVVYAVRTERGGERWLKRTSASIFYRILRAVAQVDIPAQAGDFRLLSRRAAEAIAAMPERARFLRGMAAWIGYRQVAVPYRRDPRYAGATKYPMRRMLRLAMDAMISFSAIPLRLVSALGLAFVIFCAIYLVYVLYVYFFTDRAVEGWTTVVVLILLIGGIQLLSLGIVGQYVARVFEEAKHRPLYLVDDVVEGCLPVDDELGRDDDAAVPPHGAPLEPSAD